MGLAILRISTLQKKWKVKIAQSLAAENAVGIAAKSRKYAMCLLPFITVLREGLEAVVFVGGIGLSEPASSFPLAVIVGILCGSLVGYFIYRYDRRYSFPSTLFVLTNRGGGLVRIQYFIVASSCLLYLIAASLCSRSIWFFEHYEWLEITGGERDKLGAGHGSYDVRNSVW